MEPRYAMFSRLDADHLSGFPFALLLVHQLVVEGEPKDEDRDYHAVNDNQDD